MVPTVGCLRGGQQEAEQVKGSRAVFRPSALLVIAYMNLNQSHFLSISITESLTSGTLKGWTNSNVKMPVKELGVGYILSSHAILLVNTGSRRSR